jgi:hypothetical protein
VFAEAELKLGRRLTELKLDAYALTGETKLLQEFKPGRSGRWQRQRTIGFCFGFGIEQCTTRRLIASQNNKQQLE